MPMYKVSWDVKMQVYLDAKDDEEAKTRWLNSDYNEENVYSEEHGVAEFKVVGEAEVE